MLNRKRQRNPKKEEIQERTGKGKRDEEEGEEEEKRKKGRGVNDSERRGKKKKFPQYPDGYFHMRDSPTDASQFQQILSLSHSFRIFSLTFTRASKKSYRIHRRIDPRMKK